MYIFKQFITTSYTSIHIKILKFFTATRVKKGPPMLMNWVCDQPRKRARDHPARGNDRFLAVNPQKPSNVQQLLIIFLLRGPDCKEVLLCGPGLRLKKCCQFVWTCCFTTFTNLFVSIDFGPVAITEEFDNNITWKLVIIVIILDEIVRCLPVLFCLVFV